MLIANKLRTKENIILVQQNLDLVNVRKAIVEDLDGIINVASSVGKGDYESYNGFLMDNYNDNRIYFKNIFREKIKSLDFFYVAEKKNEIVGFLIGYTRTEWLLKNPNWIKDIVWSPNFDSKKTENFVLSDKMAILAGHTGHGIGSKIYKKFIKDINILGYEYLFSETIIDPVPNFASLSFRKKQSYKLAGMRYEEYNEILYTDLIYYKSTNIL